MHPEEFNHTKSIYTDEVFEEIDRNNDGIITVEEYIGLNITFIIHAIVWKHFSKISADFWTPGEEDDKEPDWLKQERESFYQEKDLDGDKKMNKVHIYSVCTLGKMSKWLDSSGGVYSLQWIIRLIINGDWSN